MWIKICGIRDEATAGAVAALRPNAIGLNFFEGSKRYVSPAVAARIADVVGDQVLRIGVFVNASASAAIEIARTCRLDGIQFHGDESVSLMCEVARQLPGVTIDRAYRMGATLDGLGASIDEWFRAGLSVRGCLIDAHVPGLYGGSGTTVSWEALDRGYRRDAWPSLILAGGLTPGNVADAIRQVRPWGVDVASGVESAPGVKDVSRVAAFIAAARQAAGDAD